MEIKSSKFVTSVANAGDIKDFGKGEVAVAGRSNVGKSTFINFLTDKKGLAKTSATPGKTRLLNYFSINNDEFYLVDLPGYGYASKLSEEERARWDALMGGYLTTSAQLKHVLVLMDIRREPSELDKQMITFLNYHIVPFTVVLTKGDKLSRAACNRQKRLIAGALKLGVDNIIITSSLARTGKEEVLAVIEKALQQ